MKLAKPHIFKRVALLAAVCATSWTAGVPMGAAVNGSDDGPRGGVTIGPARVLFEVSPTGRWLALVPDWTGGESVISGGGFVVLALDEAGAVVELANTAAETGGRLRASGEAGGLRPVYEGVPGGTRFPLAQSDDDGDGDEDEDRLDGVDNDGDGRVDEDFAAAGDQMIALSFHAADADGEPLLSFHQECYTWTLPHIDGMVAMKIAVRNVGGRTLEDVCVGTVIRWTEPRDFAVSTQDLASPDRRDERLVSKGMLLTGSGPTAVAVVFFAEPATDDVSWLTGVTSGGRRLSDLVQPYVDARRSGVETESGIEGSATTAGRAGAPGDASAYERMAYGVSPDLGALAPGDEVVLYAALVAIPDMARVDAAINDAYRTVVGDGTHRMIPPPVAVKRRTIWGTYHVQRPGAGNTPAEATITLENARGNGIGAGDISYLTGIDLSRVEGREAFNGDLVLSVTGGLHGEIAETSGRVALRGRLKNGEFFDLVLSPTDERPPQVSQIEGVSETQYWSQPGKLKPDLLVGSPNPFRQSTTIYYEVPSNVSGEGGSVLSLVSPVQTSVKIYNVAGRLVGILVDTNLTPGKYNTSWDAVDSAGNNVASGVYYVKLQIGEKHVTKRLIQLK